MVLYMKIKICDAPVYLHSIGKSVHIDIEHPMFVRIIGRGDRAFCQGKGEHGVFIALNREMAEKARVFMTETMEEDFQELGRRSSSYPRKSVGME